jgi:hypothetical protein
MPLRRDLRLRQRLHLLAVVTEWDAPRPPGRGAFPSIAVVPRLLRIAWPLCYATSSA